MATLTPTPAVNVLERCSVAPPQAAGVAAEQILQLTFFDMLWLYLHPIQRLVCFQYPCSAENFLKTIVPNLRESLSETLRYYLPLAGNLYHPLETNPGKPEFRYTAGDSVQVTFAVSGEGLDFHHLTGYHVRNADDFHYLVPPLPEPRIESESGFQVIPLLAIQVTLFPETGIFIAVTNHHVICDANSIVSFIKAWSAISRLGNLPENHALPFYDRSVIKDPSGRADLFWNHMKQSKLGISSFKLPTNRVRATFVLQKSKIQTLRNQVLDRHPEPSGSLHLSSFAITTAYVWSCMVKSDAQSGEHVDENAEEHFGFLADVRHRLDPPVPTEYFGNCLAFAVVESRRGILKSDDGFFVAVELIGDAILRKVNDKAELWRDAGNWLMDVGPLIAKRPLGVAGSPRFDLYDADFGWGKPVKYEAVSIDMDNVISLCKSREFEGGLEIGLSLPLKKMEAFASVFFAGK